MKLDVYSFELQQKRVDKWESWITELFASEGRYLCNGCGTCPHVPDETQINIHQASYLESIRLILPFSLHQFRV